jgi:Glycosyl transferase family 2
MSQAKSMKLIMTLLVRDEEDILGANIEFHISQGVDFFIVTDNLSVDGTREVVDSYVRRGIAAYLFEPGDDYSQHRWVTRMARMAAIVYGADWVINSDADEFWMGANAAVGVKEHLQAIGPNVDCIDAPRSNCVPTERDDQRSFAERMVFRERQSFNTDGRLLPSKVCHRAFHDIDVAQGNHGVSRAAIALPAVPGPLHIVHYPVRSYAQFENKIMKGGAAYLRNTELSPGAGSTWRTLYQLWQSGGLPARYREMLVTLSQANERLLCGDLIYDDTVMRALQTSGNRERHLMRNFA